MSKPIGDPQVIFAVEGMMCQKNCASTVHEAIVSVANVEYAEVSFPDANAQVWGQKLQESDTEKIMSEVEDTGYGIELIRSTFNLEPSTGSTLPSNNELQTPTEDEPDFVFLIRRQEIRGRKPELETATALIKSAVLSVDGVFRVDVDLRSNLCYVWGFADSEAIVHALAAAGPTGDGLSLTATDAREYIPSDTGSNGTGQLTARDMNTSSKTRSIRRDRRKVLKQETPGEDFVELDLDVAFFAHNGISGSISSNEISSLLSLQSTLAQLPDVAAVVLDLEGRSVYLMYITSISTTTSSSSSSSSTSSSSATRGRITAALKTLRGSRGSSANKAYEKAIIIIIDDDGDASNSSSSSGGTHQYVIEVSGMSCANCAVKVEKRIKKFSWVKDASVSSMTNRARVYAWDDAGLSSSSITTSAGGGVGVGGVGGVGDIEDGASPLLIIDAIISMGYGARLLADSRNKLRGADSGRTDSTDGGGGEDEMSQWRRPLLVSLALGLPVLLLHISSTSSPTTHEALTDPASAVCAGGAVNVLQVLMVLLNTPILVLVGYRYYRGALLGALHGNFGMDFLVTTGTSVSFFYSAVQLLRACASATPTRHVFFEATGMLLMFVTIGKYIEAYAKNRSFEAISNLLKLQPQEALLVEHNEELEGISSKDDDMNPRVGISRSQERTRVIPLDQVKKGDILKVFPGDRIPVDGVILQGTSTVDQSMITGESMPVRKAKGDSVFGATVNQHNLLYLEVTASGADSALAQIVAMVESAQMNRAPVQAYADQVAGIFTPCILACALLTFIVWCTLSVTHVVPSRWFEEEYGDPYLFSLLFAISVVVVSCPCALGLATPTAILAGTSVGAANGILIKGGGAFETAHEIRTVVFDKTGTLTEGKPSLTDIILLRDIRPPTTTSTSSSSNRSTSATIATAQGWGQQQQQQQQQQGGGGVGLDVALLRGDPEQEQLAKETILRAAATAEQGSDHPLSRAIVRAARQRSLQLTELAEDAAEYLVGNGVKCRTEEFGTVYVGNRGMMEGLQTTAAGGNSQGLSFSSSSSSSSSSSLAVVSSAVTDAAMWNLEVQGKTAVCVAVEGLGVCAVLGIADTPKPEAYSTLQALRRLGCDVWMITGDNRTTAEALADELDLSKDRVLAGVLPADKANKIRELQQSTGKGRGTSSSCKVAMVGDGINDSPALVQADLGVAIGAGTEIAIEAADLVLIRSHLHDLVVALDLSRVVFGRVQMNFLWATVYNFLAVPYAAGIWYPWTHMLLPPQYAGLAMAASSVSVVLSSMALWLYKRPQFLDDMIDEDDSSSVVTTGSVGSSSSTVFGLSLLRLTAMGGGGGGSSSSSSISRNNKWTALSPTATGNETPATISPSTSSSSIHSPYQRLPRTQREADIEEEDGKKGVTAGRMV